jgi:Bacterial TSP3 repeat
MRIGAALSLVVAAITLIGVTQARAVPLIDVQSAGGEVAYAAGQTVGYEFSLTETYRITRLGLIDHDQNGLVEAHEIGVWDAGGNLLSSTTVPGGTAASLEGFTRWVDVAPFLLAPGRYTIGAHYATASGSGDARRWNNTITFADGVALIESKDSPASGGIQQPTDGGSGAEPGIFGPSLDGSAIWPTPIVDVQSTGSPINYFSGVTLGWEFSLDGPMVLTDLGIFDLGGDGLVESHQVGLWDASGTLVASTTFAAGTSASLDGLFRYAPITPVLLGAGSYTLGVHYPTASGGDPVRYDNSLAFADGVTFLDSKQSVGPSFEQPTFGTPSDPGFFGPNARFLPCAAPLNTDGFDTTVSTAGALQLAIACANANGSSSTDTIRLGANITISAAVDSTDGSNGTPSVTAPITIDGQGYKLSRDDTTSCASTLNGTVDATEFRLLHVGATGNLTIEDLFLENGCAEVVSGLGEGGAIYNRGTLTITRSSLDGHRAANNGGTIFNGNLASLTITDSTLSNGTANDAGAIFNLGSIPLISNSTFSGNTGWNAGTLVNNDALANITTIENSTFSGNASGNGIFGAAIDNYVGTIGNLSNTIITNSSSGPGCTGAFTGSNNLTDPGCPGDVGDVTSFDATMADNSCANPGPNGCPKTHAIMGGSSAINGAVGGTANGQRGLGLYGPRDIGAFERQLVDLDFCAAPLNTDGFDTTVSTTDDLIFAMGCAYVNGRVATDTIRLGADITLSGTVDFTDGSNGTLSVIAPITIDGQGYKLSRDDTTSCASTLNGTDDVTEFRLLHVGASGNLTIEDLFLENGCADGSGGGANFGGGIFNRGTLAIRRSSLDGHRAQSNGGAIFNAAFTTVTITDSTLSNNTGGNAGAIYNNGTIPLISNSTFSGNTGGFGGTLVNNNALANITTIENSTFSGNTSGGFGAAIDNAAGTIGNLTNTIITNSSGGPGCSGSFSGSNNLTDPNCPGDVGDVTFFDVTLVDNGCAAPGPNGCAPTHALLLGSNALDAAVSGTSTDQRGFSAFVTRDVGAWESADQDGDGLPEAQEVSLGTYPNVPDSDSDGLNDGEELTVGTNPLVPDTDGDGIPDGSDPFPLVPGTPPGVPSVQGLGLWLLVGLLVATGSVRASSANRRRP